MISESVCCYEIRGGKCRGEWRMENGEWIMENGKCRMESE
jgi:hypothetical protein